MEYKEKGLVSHSLAIMQKHDVLNKCILFSGENDVIAEMQEWFRQNGRPSGLRLEANFRFLNRDTKAKIQNMDLYEVGLNGGMYANHDVMWLKEHGILTFSNLMDVPSWWDQLAQSHTAGFKTNCALTVKKSFADMQ